MGLSQGVPGIPGYLVFRNKGLPYLGSSLKGSNTLVHAPTVFPVFWCAFDSGVQGPQQYLHSIIPGCPWMILKPPKDSQSHSRSAYTKDCPKTSEVFKIPWDILGHLVAVLDMYGEGMLK